MRVEKSGASARGSLGEVAAPHRDNVFGARRACFFGPFVQEIAESFAPAFLLGKEVDALSDGTRLAAVFIGKLSGQLSLLVAEADRRCRARRQE